MPASAPRDHQRASPAHPDPQLDRLVQVATVRPVPPLQIRYRPRDTASDTVADMLAVVYLRQSLDRTGDGHAVERQEQDARALADARGWTVAEVVTDNDTSAAGKARRPGFERLVSLVQDRAVEVVVAWDLTRLTRNARDTLRLVEAGQAAGLTVALVRGSDIDLATPAGRLTADVLSAVAHHEIAQKSDRQKRAARQAAEQGRRLGGPRAFGYEPDGITLRPVEAQALRRAYEAVLAGVPLGVVARALNDAGLGTPQRRRKAGHEGEPGVWRASTIRPTLLNPRNAGLRALWRRPETGRGRWEIIGPAQWSAIVPEETWRATRDYLADPGRRSNHGDVIVGLLTGIAYCGWQGCTSTVHRGGTSPKLGGYPTYRCRDSGRHVTRKAEPIDAWVTDVVVERLARPDAAELVVDHTRPDVEELRSRASSLRVRRRSLARLLSDGTLSEDDVRDQAADLDRQIAAVEAELTDAGRADVLGELVGAPDVRAVWEGLTLARRRAVVDAMMTVTLLPLGKVGRKPFDPTTVSIEPKRERRT